MFCFSCLSTYPWASSELHIRTQHFSFSQKNRRCTRSLSWSNKCDYREQTTRCIGNPCEKGLRIEMCIKMWFGSAEQLEKSQWRLDRDQGQGYLSSSCGSNNSNTNPWRVSRSTCVNWIVYLWKCDTHPDPHVFRSSETSQTSKIGLTSLLVRFLLSSRWMNICWMIHSESKR